MKCVSLTKNIGIFYMQKAIFSRHKKNPHYYAGFNRKSGRGWIRTIEVKEQQIYSLPPLATRELSHIKFKWSWWTDSNPRPADYKSAALPTELHQHSESRGDRTRTCGILVPNQALYQTELRLVLSFISDSFIIITQNKAFVNSFLKKILKNF